MRLILLGENGSVHIQKWIRALADTGRIELHVVTFPRGVEFAGVHYHYLKKITGTKFDYLLNIPVLRRYIREIQPDLVHAHYATSYGYLAARSGFHPLMITGWGADIFDSPKQFLMRRMLMFSFRKADALSVLSEVTQREMRKYTEKRVHLIPFGVNTSRLDVSDRKNRETVSIGTVRTLTEKYGVEYLVRAIAKIYPDRTNIRLSIVGDGPLRKMLEELTRELGIDHITTFHGYVNQNTDFPRYKKLLDEMDIFSILSVIDSETFGVASVEASACGLPVVAANVGGLPEVVIDGKTGILVPPRDVEKTAEALLRLIDHPEERDRMGKDGRAYVLERYDWERNVLQMTDVYESLIHDR